MNEAYLIMIAIFIASAIPGAIWGWRARARRRLARGTSIIEDNTVATLTGVVRVFDQTIEAPLSGVPCVGFIVTARLYGSDTGGYAKEVTRVAVLPFVLETEQGPILVDTLSGRERTVGLAEIVLPTRSLIPRKLDREKQFLADNEIAPSGVRYSHFEEATLVDGDRVRVQGLAVVDPVPPGEGEGYREPGHVVRLMWHEDHPLTIGRAR